MKFNTNFRIVFWAFILHTVWEFTQCVFLYDMWDWPFWEATIWMWAAIFGDILIVLGLWIVTTLLVPSLQFESPGYKGYMTLLFLSFLASIFLEWTAIFLGLWQYTQAMPAITIFNHEVGLSPILQITFLPALSIYLASRYHPQPKS
ncbi:MAG: hypothetical protein ACNA8K_04545 [Cyclonatronaceae bacterium]